MYKQKNELEANIANYQYTVVFLGGGNKDKERSQNLRNK